MEKRLTYPDLLQTVTKRAQSQRWSWWRSFHDEQQYQLAKHEYDHLSSLVHAGETSTLGHGWRLT